MNVGNGKECCWPACNALDGPPPHIAHSLKRPRSSDDTPDTSRSIRRPRSSDIPICGLFTLWDAGLWEVAEHMTWQAFVHFGRVNRALASMTWPPHFGLDTIGKMRRAISGKDILAIVLPSPGENAILERWRVTAFMFFALRVAEVDLHDHVVLSDAWQARLISFRANRDVMRVRHADAYMDAIERFASAPHDRPHFRFSMEAGFRGAGPARVDVPAPPVVLGDAESVQFSDTTDFAENRDLAMIRRYIVAPFNEIKHMSPPFIRDFVWRWFICLRNEDRIDDFRAYIGKLCGFSEDTFDDAMDAFLARRIAAYAQRQHVKLDTLCNRWRPNDLTFMRRVESASQCLLQLRQYRAVHGTLLLPSYQNPVLMAVRLRAVEQAAMAFETDHGSVFSGNAVAFANYKQIHSEAAHCDIRHWWALCEDVKRHIPLRAIPTLMQRLAAVASERTRTLSPHLFDADEVVQQFVYFRRWSEVVGSACIACNAPALAARAYAAVLDVWGGIPAGEIAPRMALQIEMAAETALARVAPRYWEEVLESCLAFEERVGAMPLGASRNAHALGLFVSDPHASASYSSAALAELIDRYAAANWHRLPDRATRDRTRFDNFCTRFSITLDRRDALHDAVLHSTAARVISGTCTLDVSLCDAGMRHDDAARARVERHIWTSLMQCESVSTAPWHATLMRVAVDSAYLGEKRAIYLAGTTDDVMPWVVPTGSAASVT